MMVGILESAQLPQGYETIRHGERVCTVRSDLAPALRDLGFLDGEPRRDPLRTIAGRAFHAIYELNHETKVLWKRCRRGGLIEPVLGDRHWNIRRFLKELHWCESARAHGLSVPAILGLAITPGRGGWKRVELLMELVDDARDLESGLLEKQELDPAERRLLLESCAEELRRFHGLGFVHGDLNVKNILWRRSDEPNESPIEIIWIDLDPGGAARSTPQSNLLRLYRSYLKGQTRGRWQLTQLEQLRFLHCYFRGDRPGLLCFLEKLRRMQTLVQIRRLRWRLGSPPRTER